MSSAASEGVPWSRATLVAFRFGFSVAALSFFHFVPVLSSYLLFDAVVKPFNHWIFPISDFVRQVTRYMGALPLRLIAGFGPNG